MKAAEVLQRYANNERDFRGANLRGQNFRRQDLSGADFRGADIRGTNFTKAILKNVNLSNTKTGLLYRYIVIWLGIILVFAAFQGILTTTIFTAVFLGVTSSDPDEIINGYVGIGLICAFSTMASRFNLGATLGFAIIAVLVTLTATILLAALGEDTVALATSVLTTSALMLAIGVVIVVVSGIIVIVADTVASTLGIAVAIVALVAMAMATAVVIEEKSLIAGAGIPAGIGAFLATGLNAAFLWRALKDDLKDSWVRSVAVAVAAIGGTSFRGADLTDADFSQGQLKSADLRRANLTHTKWKDATKLDRIRPGNTYLSNPKIQTLLATSNGKDQDFEGFLNLSGLNLIGANLENANFLGSTLKDATLQGANLTGANLILANLNHANLQGADFTNAKLVQTQLDHADLTGATLTGATIEEWGITSATVLNGIHCDYVFMRLPPAGARTDINPHRKPDDWNKTFVEGEFVEFITPMMETLDLYHNQAVDPRAMALAFNDLRQQHPDAELDIVSMEKRGKDRDKFLVRAEANPDADLSELHSQYFERYDYLRTLPPEALQALLVERENHVKMLAGLIGTAITKPTTNIENYQNQGDTVMGNNETNLEIGNVVGAINTGSGSAAADHFTQNVTNAESKQTLTEAAAEIQALLQQLEQSYSANSMTEKMKIATAAVEKIEANPTFKQKAVAALVAGGTKALEAAINHPAAAFVVGAIEEWKDR